MDLIKYSVLFFVLIVGVQIRAVKNPHATLAFNNRRYTKKSIKWVKPVVKTTAAAVALGFLLRIPR